MKRIFLILAASVAALAPGLASDAAMAQNGRRWEAQDNRGRDRAERGRPDRAQDRGQRREESRGRNEGRGDGRAYERRDYGPPPEAYAPPPRAYGPPAYAGPRRPAIRPGGFLPPGLRAAPLNDFARFRLRPPPVGYTWVRVGNDFLLVSVIDGQIFDIITD